MSNCLEVTRDGSVARVTLNRPEKHNAIDIDLFEALGSAGQALIDDPDVRAVILSGRGENFCSGIDFSVFGDGANVAVISDGLKAGPNSPANMFQRAAYVWREVRVPVICAITGVTFGAGMQIALGADIRLADAAARFSIMEIKWGLIPDLGLSVTARGLVPRDRLRELTYTGRIVTADEALAMGLITAIHDDPHAAAESLAAEIAEKSPDAIRAGKRLFNEALDAEIGQALAMEAALQAGIIGGDDQREAVMANLERRPARFGR